MDTTGSPCKIAGCFGPYRIYAFQSRIARRWHMRSRAKLGRRNYPAILNLMSSTHHHRTRRRCSSFRGLTQVRDRRCTDRPDSISTRAHRWHCLLECNLRLFFAAIVTLTLILSAATVTMPQRERWKCQCASAYPQVVHGDAAPSRVEQSVPAQGTSWIAYIVISMRDLPGYGSDERYKPLMSPHRILHLPRQPLLLRRTSNQPRVQSLPATTILGNNSELESTHTKQPSRQGCRRRSSIAPLPAHYNHIGRSDHRFSSTRIRLM